MHHRARDITGLQVGYLTALRYAGSNGKSSLWLVRCVCGNEKILEAGELLKMRKRGVKASCGCMKRKTISEKNKKHGMSKHPAFGVWHCMKQRCETPTHPAWKNYGGRGITVCPEWSASFDAFWRDMGPTYRQGLTLDRIDNDKGYSKANCRWATHKTQAANTRNVVLVEGIPAGDWADQHGVKRTTLYYRLAHGCPLEHLADAPDTKRKFRSLI